MRKDRKKSGRGPLCLLLTALMVLFAMLPAAEAGAASGPSVRFAGAYSSSQKNLVVTVSVKGGTSPVQSGMFMVEYDSSILSSDKSNPVVLGDAITLVKLNDTDNDRIILEWYYDKPLAASDKYTDVARLSFSVRTGSLTNISNVLWLCTDTVYLDRYGGYGDDGGVMLCYGNNDYSELKGNINIEWELESLTKITRLGGSDRFETASKIAQTGWPNGADNVVIASATSFVDALAAVPLAGTLNAPILLVSGNKLNSSVSNRLAALSPKKAYIIGGTSAVRASVQTAIESTGIKTERISGADRYETAVRIAQKLEELRSTPADTAFFAYAFNYPDALAVSSIAALNGTPILYAPSSGRISAVTARYLRSSGVKTATVLGGTKAIGSSVVESIKDAGVSRVDRISGSDRYATAMAICRKYDSVFRSDDIAIATGEAFPDALAGGAMAARLGIPVILVGKNMNSSNVRSYISTKSYINVYIFGGTSAVPQKYIDSLIA